MVHVRPLPAAPILDYHNAHDGPQALAREVVAQFAIEGDPAGGLVRVARPGALADMWKALEIAELLPAQLQVCAARCGWPCASAGGDDALFSVSVENALHFWRSLYKAV